MRVTLSIAGVAMLTLFGCSAELEPRPEIAPTTRPFMPLGDDKAEVNVYGFEPSSYKGVDYTLSVTACISRASEDKDCGYRKAAQGEFRQDAFVAETGGERKPMDCYEWIDAPESPISNRMCKSIFEHYETDQEVRVIVNEHEDTIVSIPVMPETTSPLEGTEVIVSAGQGIELSWEPSGLGEPMWWTLRYNDHEDTHLEECFTNTTLSKNLGGKLEDTGSFLIPWDTLPKNIPEYGCPVEVWVWRGREGKLDPDIKVGSAWAYRIRRIEITLKP